MADCTYSRCIQQRRNIKRDLQRWTKTMVYIVGLERIAEELMGRRKWKLYQQQDSMQRNNYLIDVVQQQQHSGNSSTNTTAATGGTGVPTMKQLSSLDSAPTITTSVNNNNTNSITTTDLSRLSEVKVEDHHQQQQDDVGPTSPQEDGDGRIRATSEDRDAIAASEEEDGDQKAGEELLQQQQQQQRPSSVLSRLTPEPRDWSPQSKCHFCVDGKLQDDNCNMGHDHHQHLLTSHGGLSPRGHQSDSDSTGDSLSDGESSPPSLLNATTITSAGHITSAAAANRRHRHRHQQRLLHHLQHRRPRSNSDVTTISSTSTTTNNHHQNHHLNHLNHLPPATAAKILQLAAHHLPPQLNMATLDTMTLAAMAAMSGQGGSGGNGAVGAASGDNGGSANSQAAVAAATAAAAAAAAAAGFPYYPGASALPPGTTLQQQHNLFQIANAMRSAAAAAAAAAAAGAESDKGSDGGGSGGGRGGEQPLDLSAKPTTSGNNTEKLANNIRLAALDSKHIFKAKPRMPTVAGRRTYTEEELQAALRDIQSGKLGTRRAAVIYGIPRSTLRNKVYKLALERERETHLNSSSSSAVPGVAAGALRLDDEDAIMDDDKELSGAEEEKEVEKALQAPLLSIADFLRCSESNTPDALKSLLLGRTKEPAAEYGQPSEQSQSPINPYLHSFLLGPGGLVSGKYDGDSMNPGVLPELIKRMFEDQMAKAHHLQQQQQHNNSDNETRSSSVVRPSPSNSVIMRTATRSESDMEAEESASNVILKIPSYKPTGSTSNSSNKNGDMSLYHRSSLDSSGSMVSPPVTSDSGSPPILYSGRNAGLHHPLKDVKDVIAASISKKFQQSEQPDQARPQLKHSISHTDSHILDFKRTGGFTPPLGGISVIKTQDLTRSYSTPLVQHAPSNKASSLQHHQQQHHQQQQHSSSNSNSSNSSSANAAGGKGTRPKRGKYRNYDRDSLVEAVRAVQRGEMSVHRAGSYYGVPHSTLEYKVKERHLMRPRKRDPKPNPVDEKIASLKLSDQQLRLGQDKLASGSKVLPPSMKQPQQGKFPPNSPNGIKLPLFDPAAAAALAAGAPIGFNPAPFPFWTPTFHSHIPTLDFNPNQSFPNNSAEHHQHQQQLLASQVMQKLHEDAARRSVSNACPASVLSNHPPNSNSTNTSSTSIPALPKSHRHIAESLLEGCTSNGSFLDGIIRSSLESGVPLNDKILLEERNSIAPENLSNKALLEQLMCRNNRLKSNMSETSSGDEVDAGSYRKEVPSPSGMNENSMEHDQETIELSNDSQDGRPLRNIDEDEEEDHREEVIIQPPVQGRIYVKHDLIDRGPSERLLRFRDLSHLESPVCVIDRNGILGEECSAGSEPLDNPID